jgi:TolB-like protein
LGSVVVLPLENLTGDNASEYLTDGITEELTNRQTGRFNTPET